MTQSREWQERLLPLMIGLLVGLTVFFFAASLFQLAYLHANIREAPHLDLQDVRAAQEAGEMPAQMLALIELEGNALERRYHQANVFLMSRVWVRYLGFVTGMILALVGAAFILGKLRDEASDLAMKGSGVEMTLKTASPGLVLAFLGVVLMLATIVTHHEIATADAPIYLDQTSMREQPAVGDPYATDTEQENR